MSPPTTLLLAVLVAAIVCLCMCSPRSPASSSTSLDTHGKPGKAGYALLFNDHVLSIMNPKGLPSDQFTFEAWISTADYCHEGTIFSYAIKPSDGAGEVERIAAANHFTVYNTKNVIGCHDIAYFKNPLDVPNSCYGMYKPQTTVSVVDREAGWHHLAVTWDGKSKGLSRIYLDGSLMASASTNKTGPVQAGGMLALGQEQDCFAGCFQTQQAFFGLMDEVRLWRTARTQEEISKNMRLVQGLENNKDLIAYWKFDDPVTHPKTAHDYIFDHSGRQNHLPLGVIPTVGSVNLPGNGRLSTATLKLHSNYLVKKKARMPQRSFTIEFWARGDLPHTVPGGDQLPAHATILSYATRILRTDSSGNAREGVFADDAIRISRVFKDYVNSDLMPAVISSTTGSLSLHVNSNPHEDVGNNFESWIDFETNWKDDKWHHVALTWEYSSGAAHCYFDGQEVPAFWMQEGPIVSQRGSPTFSPMLSKQIARIEEGALFIGVDQDCFGSCLVTEESYIGELAMLRVWDRVKTRDQVVADMYEELPTNMKELLSMYNFKSQDVIRNKDGSMFMKDHEKIGNNLQMRVLAPRYQFSTAPLAEQNGLEVEPPRPGPSGYALQLSDRQVVMVTDFRRFPSDAITVEFWARSSDRCRKAAPFSYATGEYGKGDNSFLIFNYNSLGVAVMEQEGLNGVSMHTSGVSITDGQWHYVAVTWDSRSGNTRLFVDGRLMWVVTRAKGKKIAPGGTLVLGREQDCMGGCFDSMDGAAGKTDAVDNTAAEYGPQDFTGAMENLRIWKSVKSHTELWENYVNDIKSFTGSGDGVGTHHQDLLAFYKFDEGKGFLVKDAVYSNHLHILTPSKWEVMHWEVECGNGILELGEECDDGDVDSGNGCSSDCAVEKGWSCNPPEKGQPSYCYQGSGSHSRSSGSPSSHPASGPTTNPTHSHSGAIAAGVIITILVVGALVAGYIKRQWVYDTFPPVEQAMDWVGRLVGRPSRPSYAGLHLDAEELDLSPEFIQPSQARTVGSPGVYLRMPDAPLY